jgi:polyisoprenoid-binding protein YceI
MKNLILVLTALLIFTGANAQKFMTKTGKIVFNSDAPLEKIEAVNKQVNSALDTKTGSFVFKVMIKSFVFEKALMQEHFNENYMESDKFPQSTFTGSITNIKDVNFSKDGVYNVNVEGPLTIHGVTKSIKTKGTLEVKAGKVTGKAVFNVLLKDYNITLPSMVIGKVAENIAITVDVTMDKLN